MATGGRLRGPARRRSPRGLRSLPLQRPVSALVGRQDEQRDPAHMHSAYWRRTLLLIADTSRAGAS
jgi:hypothetical protein